MRKSGALGGENSLAEGLFGALNVAGAWTGAASGVAKEKATHPGPLTGVGWGIGAWARRLWGPRGLVKNITRSLDCPASVTAGNVLDQSL